MFKGTVTGLLFGLFCWASMGNAQLPPDYKVSLLTSDAPPAIMAKEGKTFARGDDIQGYAADIVREMFKRAAVPFNMEIRSPFEREVQMLNSTANTGLFLAAQTEGNKAKYKWVGPFGDISRVLVADADRARTIELARLEDAALYKVGATDGDGVAKLLDQKGIPYLHGLSDKQSLTRLANGDIDLWATNDPGFGWQAKREGIKAPAVVITVSRSQTYLALNLQTLDEVVDRLQKALDSMQADGTVRRMSTAYSGQ